MEQNVDERPIRVPATLVDGTTTVIQQLMNQRMFPLSLPGLEGAMRLLVE